MPAEPKKRTKQELLDRAIELSLKNLVERLESGEEVSSGELSFLNSISKTSNIKPIEAETSVNDIGLQLANLVTKPKSRTHHYKDC